MKTNHRRAVKQDPRGPRRGKMKIKRVGPSRERRDRPAGNDWRGWREIQ